MHSTCYICGINNMYMKTYLYKILLAFLFITVPASAIARVYNTSDLPNVRLQDLRMHLSDPENIISRTAADSINSMLHRLETATSIEVAVIVVPSVAGGDCFGFAYNIGKLWGVGKEKKDNGLVILLATEDRCVQFVTGYGLEGIMPDAICKRIQNRYMLPHFSENDWDSGLLEGVKATCSVLDGSMTPDEMKKDSRNGGAGIFLLLLIGTIGIAIISALYTQWKSKRCSVCGKHTLVRYSSQKIADTRSYKISEITYVCSSCGHVEKRRVKTYKDNGNSGGSGPIIFGGFGGFGSSGGGGFGGGSFGGGSFGGGGAGSKF